MPAPAWIEERVVSAVLKRQLAEHGGAAAVRDPVALYAALAWPRSVAMLLPRPRLSRLAAAYAWGFARLRPFTGGNLRTGFVLAMTFLRLNGVPLPASPYEKYALYSALARGRMPEEAFAEWIEMRHLANRESLGSLLRVRKAPGRKPRVYVLRGGRAADEAAAGGQAPESSI